MNAWAKVGVVVVAMLVAVFVTHTYDTAQRDAAVGSLEAKQAKALKEISDSALLATNKANAERDAANARADAIDTKYTKEKTDALAENKRLADAVAAGDRKLRIQATCPAAASGNSVPATAAATSVDDGTTVELAPATGRTVFDIRAGIVSDTKALAALQGWVRASCAPATP